MISVFSLAGCKKEAVEEEAALAVEEEAAAEEAVVEEEEVIEPVEITFWCDWGGEGQKQFEAVAEKFNQSQDRIVAKYECVEDYMTKFLTVATTGETPDILWWDRYRTYLFAPKGVLHPIDEYIERDKVRKEDFYEEPLRELTWDGKIYGLPVTVDNRCLFYNKKLLDEKGLTPPTTWDELRECAKALTVWEGDKLEVAGWSLQDVGLFSMYILQAGGQMLTDDGTKTAFNSEAGLKVLEFWDQLLNEDKVYKWGFEAGLEAGIDPFTVGKGAMIYNGPWALPSYMEYGKELEFGIVPPPAGPEGDKGAMCGGFGLVISEGSQHKEEAWEFIKWWVVDNPLEYSKVSLNIPGNKVAANDPFFTENEMYRAFIQTMEFAKIRPPVPGYSDVETLALRPQLQLFMEGKITAEEALSKAQEMGDKILKEASEEL